MEVPIAPAPMTITSGLTRPILICVSRESVDEAAQPQVFAGARLLVEGAGGHLPQARGFRPLHDAAEPVDLPVHMAVRLEDLEEGGPLTTDLPEIGKVP